MADQTSISIIDEGNYTIVSQMVEPSESDTEQEVVTPDTQSESGSGSAFFSQIDWLGIFLGLIVVAVIAVIVYLTVRYLKYKDREEKSKDWNLYEIRVPKENEIEVGVAEQLFANLSGIGGGGKGFLGKYITVHNSVSFEIVGLPESINFYIYCPRKLASWVEKQVLGSYQDAEFTEAPEHNIFREDGRVAFASLIMSDEPYNPFKTYQDFEGDTMAHVTSALSKIESGEGAVIQLVISPSAGKWQKAGQKFVNKVEENNADPEKKRINVSQEQTQAISKKCSKAGFSCALRVVTVAKDDATAKMHLDNIVGAYDQFSSPGMNELKRKKISPLAEREFMKNFMYRQPAMKPELVLNVEELATFYHFPNKEVQTPHINWLLSREAPAAAMVPTSGTWLGTAKFRGQSKDVYIKDEDRMRHIYVVGQTGSGKSWLLQSMALQDIYAGNGVAIIDPHGSLAEYVIQRIPHERAEDVIYFNPSDYDRPLGFNIMDYYDEQDKHRVVNGFLGLLTKMFDPQGQGITGPRFEQAVRNAMLTAMSKKGSTLIEVVRILTDDKWVKEEWLPILKDDMVRRYWTDQIAKTSDFHKSEILGYIVSKFDRFVTNIAMRNIIGQSESSFDVRKVMDDEKILIVNLSKGLIGEENAQFLGLLLVPKILSAALSRENVPEEDRKDFFLYVDEFQNFATPDFAQILSEARKYRLSLNVGNQYIGQMSDQVKDAVFGNVGTLVTMRVGPDDGKYLETQYEPVFTANDLINQPNIHACIKLLVDGKYPPPFSMDTRYESDRYPKFEKVTELVKKISRLKYGRDREVVESEITERAQLAAKAAEGVEKKLPAPPSLPMG
ncbi:type IV secretory system conjugative DNA transfer family protein [Candidatus Dojkabacteria bacterium]|nr:type IV secretory system conjugative DNA transfer family protein [Candidatus Dojkabacteria bacterium]